MRWNSTQRKAFLALLGGAAGIGCAPIFVRLSEVGPSATAFYRVLIALPLLWAAIGMESRRSAPRASASLGRGRPDETVLGIKQDAARSCPRAHSGMWWCAVAGALFAGDLAFWHWSIQLTSVANSTLLTNCAPFFVILGARVVFSERITGWLLLGMALALVGSGLLVGASLQLTAGHLRGDLLALVTAGFYGGYLLTVKYLRRTLSTAQILGGSGLVSCSLLLLVAVLSHESIRVVSIRGWMVLLGLGLISHIGGQGLIAYALAHLPAGFSSVSLLLQPVVAAVLAWGILFESLSVLQLVGGLIILLGIALSAFRQSG